MKDGIQVDIALRKISLFGARFITLCLLMLSYNFNMMRVGNTVSETPYKATLKLMQNEVNFKKEILDQIENIPYCL